LSSQTIGVIGAGAWGTALAIQLGQNGRSVQLWARESEVAESLTEHRENPLFLPGARVPESVRVSGSMAEVLEGAAALVAVVPSAYARQAYIEMAPEVGPRVPVVVAAKGIEEGSLALPLQVAADVLGHEERLAVISGPSFAAELVRGKATAVVAAARDGALAERVQQLFSSGTLRVYASRDPVGVQLAGALKNVIAIAAGVADGLGMGSNALAALITRGLAEISRLGRACGGQAATFSGLAGLGDLVLTCTGGLSRNRQVGQRLGRGESLDAILSSTRSVAEGVRTTRSARELARRHGVEMPIVEELHRLLFEGGTPDEALGRLMNRPLTSEEQPEEV